MSNERIDLTQWKNEHREVYACCEASEHYTDILLAELKRCYEKLDKVNEQLADVDREGLSFFGDRGWIEFSELFSIKVASE
mgnify:CR=1 FL=1